MWAQSVLINKISASKLSRKFIKECVVGWDGGIVKKASPYFLEMKKKAEKVV